MDIGTANVGVKVYTVNGAAAGTGSASSLPDWLKRKRAVKSGRSKRAIREEFEGAVNLIQDFEFPEASNRIRVTRDGHHAIATGVYKPRMKTYDLDQLTLKFERHTDAENVEFLILSDDWTKSIHLQSDRSIELHAQGGLHYRTRIPRFGRALAYHYPSCDTLVGGAGNEVYRLNLQQGRFLSPMVLEGDAERGTVQGVNAIDINPAHNLISLATDGPGTVEFWDPRSRTAVGILRLPQSLQNLNSKHSTNLLPELLANEPLAATALSSRMNGLSLAVGTSTGHTLLYDIRSSKPYATKDQGYGFPIKRVQWIEGSSSRMAGDNYVFSADKKVLKVWADDSPETNFASVTTPTDINDVCHVPGSGLFMLANEGIHMTSYYIPQLGPAPKWCSFLDNLTEEMEDQTVRNTYEDFKFLDKDELASLGLDHLLGTPALKPYMHGYFVSLKLYDAARVIANPFVYAEHRQKAIRQKMEKLADSRIRTRKDQLPKVNRALAERILENQEKENRKKRKREEEEEEAEQVEGEEVEMEKKKEKKKVGSGAAALFSDPRFKAVFEDPDFEIDETSKQFALLHPSQADQATNKRKMRTAVDEEDSEGDGGMSSDDLGMSVGSSEKESDKEDEESSEEEMETINLRSGGPQPALMQRKNMPKMVSARPDTSNLSRFKVRDPSATFGQRRQYSGTGNSRKDTTSDQITRANDDGGVTISFVPQSSKNKDIAQRSNENRQKKQGIEYLGAGLERGVEKLEVSEKDRKGRTERRKGVRSGSKNVFRGM